MDNRKFLPLIIAGIIGLFVILYLSSSLFVTVESGYRGVIFKKFAGGLDKENVIQPGFMVKAPWNDIYIYEVRERSVEEKMDVLDRNGLSLGVEVSIRFNPLIHRIGHLHETFGPDYVNTLVIPETRSAVRKIMGRYSAEEIYSTKRKEVEDSIRSETEALLGGERNNILVNAMLFRSIVLPDQIKDAIELKLKEEQEALAYQFKLDKEKSEAERRRIAAEGEAAANEIVSKSLTTNLLRMRGIEATMDLSKSQNTKVIVIGSGKDGLPLILGDN